MWVRRGGIGSLEATGALTGWGKRSHSAENWEGGMIGFGRGSNDDVSSYCRG